MKMRNIINTVAEGFSMLETKPKYRRTRLERLLQRRIGDLFALMNKKFGPCVGSGRHRAVWGDRNYVFKVPQNLAGWRANIREYLSYRMHGAHKPLAKCRLVYLKGIPILVMERVGIITQNKPEWAYSAESGQVGRNAAGRTVSYDYANSADIDEMPSR